MMMQLNGYKGNDMSIGGSSTSGSQLDPALRDAYLANIAKGEGVAQGLGARQFSGLNQDQQSSFAATRQFADPNSKQQNQLSLAGDMAYQSYLNRPRDVQSSAYGGATVDPAAQASAAQINRSSVRDVGAAGVSGQQVASTALGQIAPQARQNIRDIQAGSSLNQNVQQYMNPYTQAVTDQSLKDLERSRQLQQQQTSAQATAAKAFGGSRQGIAEAETNRAYGENAARLVAQQNAEAFQSAQRASESDLSRSMQAQQLNQAQDAATTQQALALSGQFGLANQDASLRAALANQGVDVSTGQSNLQAQQQANLANQAAINARASQQAGLTQQAGLSNAQGFLQANLANQQADLARNQQGLAASNQLAGIAGQGQQMGLAGANALAQQGVFQQQNTQQQLDAQRNLALEQQQIRNQALGINPGGGSGMQTTSSSGQGLLGIFR
jgi:hypothetical protein